MVTKRCGCCGRELPIEDFSKAYKDLCRDCYVALVRNRRAQIGKDDKKKMAAINWEHVRAEAAINAMAALVPHSLQLGFDLYRCGNELQGNIQDDTAKLAVGFADKLVAALLIKGSE